MLPCLVKGSQTPYFMLYICWLPWKPWFWEFLRSGGFCQLQSRKKNGCSDLKKSIVKREVVLRLVTELTWMASQTLSVLRDNPSLPQTSWSASQTLLVNFSAASCKEGETQTAVRVQEFQEKPRHKQERQMQGKHYYFSELQLLWLIQL